MTTAAFLPRTHKKRFAANRMSSTDPEVATTTVMLSAVRKAVDSTIAKRPAAGAVCPVRPFLDFACFFVTMMNASGIRSHVQLDADVPIEVGLDRAMIACGISEMLKGSVNGEWPSSMVYVSSTPREPRRLSNEWDWSLLYWLGCRAGKPAPSNCGKLLLDCGERVLYFRIYNDRRRLLEGSAGNSTRFADCPSRTAFDLGFAQAIAFYLGTLL
jgi:hypothetical protein